MEVGSGLEMPVLPTGPPSGLSVLIVEDQTDTALSQAIVLSLGGHSVKVARDGVTALRKVRELEPDVVLLDLGLPKLDGYQVAREIIAMQLKKRPLLVAITGYGMAEDKRKSKQAGVQLHLVKPVQAELLLKILKKFQSMTSDERASSLQAGQ